MFVKKKDLTYAGWTETGGPTWSLHQVFLLAVAVAAHVIEGEQKVMLLVELRRQLHLYLVVREKQRFSGSGAFHMERYLLGIPRRRTQGSAGGAGRPRTPA